MRIAVLAFTLSSAALAAGVLSEAIDSARVAAVRFALSHGLEVPSQNLVVAVDTTFGWPDGSPVRQTAQEKQREAELIAQLIGASVKVGKADDYVSCPQRRCYATTSTWVLVVDGLAVGESDIRVRLFAPDAVRGDPSRLISAVIDVESRESGWVGVRYRRGPNTLIMKR